MIKLFTLYIKHQIGYLLYLLILFVLPLGLFFHFSPYELPNIEFIILGVLYLSQFFFFREKEFRRKNHDQVIRILKKELGRTPSQQEVYSRCSLVISYRIISVVFVAIGIFLLAGLK